jgi:hypothetical protein
MSYHCHPHRHQRHHPPRRRPATRTSTHAAQDSQHTRTTTLFKSDIQNHEPSRRERVSARCSFGWPEREPFAIVERPYDTGAVSTVSLSSMSTTNTTTFDAAQRLWAVTQHIHYTWPDTTLALTPDPRRCPTLSTPPRTPTPMPSLFPPQLPIASLTTSQAHSRST